MRPTHVARSEAPLHRDRAPDALALIESGVDPESADVLVAEPEARALFEALCGFDVTRVEAASFVVNEVRRALADGGGTPDPAKIAALMGMVRGREITSAVARQVLGPVLREGADPAAWVAAHGLTAIVDDRALSAVVAEALAEAPDRVSAYKAGKTGLLGMFVGSVMKRTGGRADAARVKDLLERALEE